MPIQPSASWLLQFGAVWYHPYSTLIDESAAQIGKDLSLKESTFYSNMLLTSKQHILGILEENYSSLFNLLHMI